MNLYQDSVINRKSFQFWIIGVGKAADYTGQVIQRIKDDMFFPQLVLNTQLELLEELDGCNKPQI